MERSIWRFWLLVVLVVSGYRVTGQEVEQQLNDSATYWSGNSEVQSYILEALRFYKNDNYELALKQLDVAISLSKNDPQLLSLRQSLNRLMLLRQVNDGHLTKEKQVKLDWNSFSDNIVDKNRFLFRALTSLDFNTLTFLNQNAMVRMAVSASLEGFLPYMDESFGLYIGFNTQFFDIDAGMVVHDYQMWDYQVAFQWRLGWTLPALEQRVTLALRFGVAVRNVNLILPDSFPNESLSYYVLPLLDIYMQDALLSHFWSNSFTENLLFAPTLAFAWLPFGRYPTAFFKLGLGISYRIGSFTLGPSYLFSYQYNSKTGQSLQSSVWAIVVSYQYAP